MPASSSFRWRCASFLPDGHSGAWLTVFTLETILYAVGTAFIVMLMVKDHHVHVYRTAASPII